MAKVMWHYPRKRLILSVVSELVEEAFKNKTPIDVVIKEIVKGGAVADYKGVRIFIPAFSN